LVWGEQGVGDEIMFSGLIPDVIRTGNRCLLDCDPRLNPLFTRSFPGIDVVSGIDLMRDPKLDIAAHVPSGSLPSLFRASHAAFASTTSPYLVADPVARERFRAHYNDGRRLIGLAWYTKNRSKGRDRSIDLSLFASLFARSDIRWVSLQYGDHDDLQSQAASANTPILIDRSVNQFSDIDLFAAQIAALDMVVTIDNSTAHLAGALGVPALVLLPFVSDWRWLQAREDSPWYPTLRLFRQPEHGDWQSVMQRVQSAL
jgi:ADP-heptose:LPS heptosyltransferase